MQLRTDTACRYESSDGGSSNEPDWLTPTAAHDNLNTATTDAAATQPAAAAQPAATQPAAVAQLAAAQLAAAATGAVEQEPGGGASPPQHSRQQPSHIAGRVRQPLAESQSSSPLSNLASRPAHMRRIPVSAHRLTPTKFPARPSADTTHTADTASTADTSSAEGGRAGDFVQDGHASAEPRPAGDAAAVQSERQSEPRAAVLHAAFGSVALGSDALDTGPSDSPQRQQQYQKEAQAVDDGATSGSGSPGFRTPRGGNEAGTPPELTCSSSPAKAASRPAWVHAVNDSPLSTSGEDAAEGAVAAGDVTVTLDDAVTLDGAAECHTSDHAPDGQRENVWVAAEALSPGRTVPVYDVHKYQDSDGGAGAEARPAAPPSCAPATAPYDAASVSDHTAPANDATQPSGSEGRVANAEAAAAAACSVQDAHRHDSTAGAAETWLRMPPFQKTPPQALLPGNRTPLQPVPSSASPSLYVTPTEQATLDLSWALREPARASQSPGDLKNEPNADPTRSESPGADGPARVAEKPSLRGHRVQRGDDEDVRASMASAAGEVSPALSMQDPLLRGMRSSHSTLRTAHPAHALPPSVRSSAAWTSPTLALQAPPANARLAAVGRGNAASLRSSAGQSTSAGATGSAGDATTNGATTNGTSAAFAAESPGAAAVRAGQQRLDLDMEAQLEVLQWSMEQEGGDAEACDAVGRLLAAGRAVVALAQRGQGPTAASLEAALELAGMWLVNIAAELRGLESGESDESDAD